jgi:hemerythrin
MALVEWNEKLSVNVSIFDEEHRRLIEMLNELQAAMLKGKGADVSRQILARLASYTASHFRHEEEMMQRHAYPAFAAHKAEHVRLTRQVAEFDARLARGEATITIGLLTFLRDWLTTHIQQTDRQYGAYFATRGLV